MTSKNESQIKQHPKEDQLRQRFKDILWLLRVQFGFEPDIDRILPFVVFSRDLAKQQFENCLVDYPKRTPEDYRAALCIEIQRAARIFWQYTTERKGYHKLVKQLKFLEFVLRHGFSHCQLILTKNTGYQLVKKTK